MHTHTHTHTPELIDHISLNLFRLTTVTNFACIFISILLANICMYVLKYFYFIFIFISGISFKNL